MIIFKLATTIKLETLTLKVLSHKLHKYLLEIKHILNHTTEDYKTIFFTYGAL